jgi:putative hydrolase of the HAD superfamily
MSAQSNKKPLRFNDYQLFIFDLDGTLYDQKRVRRTITKNLVLRFLCLRASMLELKIIFTFRKEREKHLGYASQQLDDEQFEWCASVLKIQKEKVRRTIEYWMYKFPLRYMLTSRFTSIEKLFNLIKEQGKQVVVYSDFPAKDKLNALQIKADMFYCATDKEISQLKPSGSAVKWICEDQNYQLEQTILIGDRDDTDGESARLAGIDYIIIDPKLARNGNFYSNLMNQFKNNDQ